MKSVILSLMVLVSISMGTLEGRRGKLPPEGSCIMVFAPHPDDDIIGCGGAIAYHVANGSTVVIVYMTSGDAIPWWEGDSQELADIREAEARRAAEKLGVTNLIFLRKPDGKLACTKKNTKRIAHLISEYKPDVVYTPHSNDGHKDHKNTFCLVINGVKEAKKGTNPWDVSHVLCYEVWTPLQRVTHTLPLSKWIDEKLAALKEHASQVGRVNYSDAIKGLNRYRGITCFAGSYAECFKRVVP